MARTHEIYELKAVDRQALEAICRSSKAAQGLASRAKVILFTASGQTPDEVAAALGTTTRAVYRWRKRFKYHGLEGFHDRPRPGQPTKLSKKVVKEVLRLSVKCIPHGTTHWSLRLMAKAAGITTWQVRQVWDAADVTPGN